MQAAQRLDDNPCRPRHFKPPPPCAPVVADERANQVIETCRTRLVAAAALFAVVFLVVVLRLAEIVLVNGGGAESHIGRLPPAAPPPPARADIVDRNGTLLATMLPKPSLFVNSKALLAAGQNPDEAAHQLASVLAEAISVKKLHPVIAAEVSGVDLSHPLGEETIGRIKEAWGTLTDDDLDRAEGKLDRLVGTIEEKTGESADAIREKLQKLAS